MGMSYMPRKLSRTSEEAKLLGYCSEVPVDAATFLTTPAQGPLPLTDSSTAYVPPSPAYIPHTAPKPASWGLSTDASASAAAIYTAPPPFPEPYLSQQMYGSPAAPQDLYQQPLQAPPSHGI
jgi:hypothetical protein